MEEESVRDQGRHSFLSCLPVRCSHVGLGGELQPGQWANQGNAGATEQLAFLTVLACLWRPWWVAPVVSLQTNTRRECKCPLSVSFCLVKGAS